MEPSRMRKNKIIKQLYFCGDMEVVMRSCWIARAEAEALYPSIFFVKLGFNPLGNHDWVGFGSLIEDKCIWKNGEFVFPMGLYPITRAVKYEVTALHHICDWKCMGAFPNGECSCECGGRNHGRRFTCEIIGSVENFSTG
jgi:hypothetical protein